MNFYLKHLLGVLALLAAGAAAADDSLQLQRSLIAAGGGSASGGEFRLQGSVGQAEADALQPSVGGEFSLLGGFWAGLRAQPAAPPGPLIFVDGFEQP